LLTRKAGFGMIPATQKKTILDKRNFRRPYFPFKWIEGAIKKRFKKTKGYMWLTEKSGRKVGGGARAGQEENYGRRQNHSGGGL